MYDDKETEIAEKACVLLQEINNALDMGTKHYRKSDNMLLTSVQQILKAMIDEGGIYFVSLKVGKRETMKKTCDKPAEFRYTWPGQDESFCCAEHGKQIIILANIMNSHLQMIQLTTKETCRQIINKGKTND